MIRSMIAAMGKNRVIGQNNQMMWHLPLEYKYFKETTMGHCLIMGRKNYEAQGRLLPGRTNIIVTRKKDFEVDGAIIVHSIEEGLEVARGHQETEVFIIGGGEIYRQSLDLVDRIYLTEVDFDQEGDVYFPNFDESLFEKKELMHQGVSEKNKLAWTAYLYKRI